ncbi:MAG: TetR/AcrR family transcriptional regulator [Thermoleophilia bacterium]
MARQGDTTRERLLEETTRLVHRKGFGATSMKDILEASGLTKGSLYHHFPGKDDLGLAVLERARVEFEEFLDTKLVGASPAARLESFFAAVLARHQALEFTGGCIFGNTALELADREARHVPLVARVFREWSARLEEVLAAGQASGEVRDDLPASLLALHAVAVIEGGIMLSRLEKDEGPLRGCLQTLRALLQPPGA